MFQAGKIILYILPGKMIPAVINGKMEMPVLSGLDQIDTENHRFIAACQRSCLLNPDIPQGTINCLTNKNKAGIPYPRQILKSSAVAKGQLKRRSRPSQECPHSAFDISKEGKKCGFGSNLHHQGQNINPIPVDGPLISMFTITKGNLYNQAIPIIQTGKYKQMQRHHDIGYSDLVCFRKTKQLISDRLPGKVIFQAGNGLDPVRQARLWSKNALPGQRLQLVLPE